MFSQEEEDAGTAGVLMGGGCSGLFQLLPGVCWDWKVCLLSRMITHVWQEKVVSDYGHGCNKASDLAFGVCVVLL